MTKYSVVRAALEDLRRQDFKVKDDDLELANFYYDQGFDFLMTSTGKDLNPMENAGNLAGIAIKEYIKSALKGMLPESDPNVRLAIKTWARRATVEKLDDDEFSFDLGRDITEV